MPRYLIPTSRELIRINPDRLVCVVAGGNYSTLYHVDDCRQISSANSRDIESYTGGAKMVLMQLGQIEDAIAGKFRKDDQHFIRIGNSLIVNIDYISAIDLENTQIELSDNETFHICRKASAKALAQIKDYLESQEAVIRSNYKKTDEK